MSRILSICTCPCRSALIPLRTTLPSPTRHKHSKPDLQQLTQPGAMQALTNRIHQRLQLQSSIADMSSSSEACETGKVGWCFSQPGTMLASCILAGEFIELMHPCGRVYRAYASYAVLGYASIFDGKFVLAVSYSIGATTIKLPPSGTQC